MKVAAALLVVLVSSAHAEPFRPRPENLHVSVSCADYWAGTERGLLVMADGVPQRPVGENGAPAVEVGSDGTSYTSWVTTDVSYSLAPGAHHLAISAPGCAPLEQDVDSSSVLPIFVSGRLPVDDPSLSGPTGAPNGVGIASGLYIGGRGAHVSTNDIFNSSHAYDQIQTTGAYLTTSIERRGLAIAFDMLVSRGTTAGMATSTSQIDMQQSMSPFTGSVTQVGMAARVGVRQRRGQVAFAEGAGIGGGMWIQSFDTSTPTDIDGEFYVPLWAQVTYKPGCNWGGQVLASYDVHPGSSNEDMPTLMAGLTWQPNAACSEPAGLALR